MPRFLLLVSVAIVQLTFAPTSSIQAQDATPSAISSEEVCAPYVNADATPAVELTPDGTPVDLDLVALEFDLLFIDAMIPHHEMAIAMAVVVIDRSERPEINQMAEVILSAQASEVDLMTSWRTDWYPDVPSLSDRQLIDAMNIKLSESPGVGGVAGLEEMGMEHMERDVAELCTTTDDVDLLFIDLMIEHHSSAVILGQVAAENALHPEVIELAATIVQDQQAEIDQMLVWRDQWFPGEPFPDHHDA